MLIYIDYDKTLIFESEMSSFCKDAERIIGNMMEIERDIPTYASSYEITHNIYPIEIFIKVTKNKVKDKEEMLKKLWIEFATWKKTNHFPHNISLSIIPMDWVFELNI